jgi:tRNA(fMet)-specific endonuclease VapC
MTYLLDTNAVGDLIREHPKLDARLAALTSPDRVVICPIVRGETLYGVHRLPVGKRRDILQQKADKILRGLSHEATPIAAGDHYSDIKTSCERRGVPLGENDLWIAATALALGAVLVTRDSDFNNVNGLVIQDWAK